MILGLVLWYCLFNSGIHATVAGVLFAFFIPIDSLGRLEAQLHAPVYFIIIPIFALANTAISISSNTLDVFNGPLTWGIIAGLCIGKPLG
ncbi:Na+/H+ antiporter NhaA, partial [Acinetobacter baumannii]